MARQKKPEDEFLDPGTEYVQPPESHEIVALRERVKALEEQLAAKGAAVPPSMPVARLEPCPGDETLPYWRVQCMCPTPLQYPILEVNAADAHQAKAIYCVQNQISDSVHPWKIEQIPPTPDQGPGRSFLEHPDAGLPEGPPTPGKPGLPGKPPGSEPPGSGVGKP